MLGCAWRSWTRRLLFSDVWCPRSGAVDNEVGSEDPVGCPHCPDRIGFDVEPDHLDTALDPGACGFCCHCDSSQRTMLVQVPVGCAVAASCEAELSEDRPTFGQVFRNQELARDAQLVLELDLVPQGLKLGFIAGKKEVPDPPQPGVDAESFFELSPVRLAENREFDVGGRPQL
jgi:hypothetical protein